MTEVKGSIFGGGDMKKETYDPDNDGVIEHPQTKADMEKKVYDEDENNIIDKLQVNKKFIISEGVEETKDVSDEQVYIETAVKERESLDNNYHLIDVEYNVNKNDNSFGITKFDGIIEGDICVNTDSFAATMLGYTINSETEGDVIKIGENDYSGCDDYGHVSVSGVTMNEKNIVRFWLKGGTDGGKGKNFEIELTQIYVKPVTIKQYVV